MGMLGRCIGDTFPRVPRICACPLYVLPNESNSYDANGNRTNTGDVTGADNELLSDGTYNYSYDANGNLVKQVTIADNSEIDYAYDFRNRLVKVTNKDSNGLTTQVVDYSYDAFNRLVTRTVTPTIPPRVDYELTDLGRSLCEPVQSLNAWAMAHIADIERSRSAFDQRQTMA